MESKRDSQTDDRSYRGLKKELRKVISNEVAVIKDTRGPWILLYAIQLPIVTVFFIPMAIISALIWPLGNTFRPSVTVGLIFGLTVPLFQLVISYSVCKNVDIPVSVRLLYPNEKPVQNQKIVTNNLGVLYTDGDGYLKFEYPTTRPRYLNRSVGRQYCPDCFEDQVFRFTIQNEALGVDTTVVRTFNYGNYYLSYQSTKDEQENTTPFPLENIILYSKSDS